jgi:peptidoglycan/LPS O-acetylase OafA/YrhL
MGSGPSALVRDNSRGLPDATYAPGLDGLRALAVLSVVAFHGGVRLLPGGFVGVSLFFTLSGFLITRLLLSEWQHRQRIGLRGFWERRLRRLAPAALLTLGVIMLASPHLMDPVSRAGLRVDVLAALAYVANWRFLFQGHHYADLFTAPSPVLHFWSLAIEEQFYVLFPLIAAAVLRVRRGSTRALAIVLGLLFVASVASQLAHHDLDRVYLGTDTRAGELLAGALLAIAMTARPLSRRLVALSGGLALVAFVGLASTLSIRSPWLGHGGLACLAIINVALIAVGAGGVGIARVFAWRPLTAIGRVSYGLYLVHWPVFLWLNERRTGWHGVQLAAARLALAALLTVTMYHLLECPVRFRRVLQAQRRLVPVAAGAALAVLVAAIVMPAPRLEPLTDPSVLRATSVHTVHRRVRPLRVMLLGDRSAATSTKRVHRGRGTARGRVIIDDETRAGCSTVMPGGLQAFDLVPSIPSSCPGWQRGWPRRARRFHPDLVVVHASATDVNMHTLRTTDPRVAAGRAYLALSATYQWVSGVLRGTNAAIAWSPPTVTDMQRLPGATDPTARSAYLRLDRSAIVVTASAALGVVELDGPLNADRLWDAYRQADNELGRHSRRGPGAAPVRVLLTGDSTSLNLAAGLGAHGAVHRDLVVDWAGQNACPLARVSRFREVGDNLAFDTGECRLFTSLWTEHIARFHPDLILVVVSFMDAADLARTSGSGWEHLGESDYNAFFASELDTAVLTARPAGVRLAFATAPLEDALSDSATMTLRDRLSVLNRQLAQLAARDRRVLIVPLAAHVDRSDGRVDRATRPDGVHFTVTAARAMADRWLARDLVRLARS